MDECKAHEDRYVAVLAAEAVGADQHRAPAAWVGMWAAYVAFVVDPVKAWIEALRR